MLSSTKKSRLLIMGNSGHGKTFFSSLLRKQIDCYYFNADLLREIAKDADFSDQGRIRQAKRMRFLADNSPGLAVCDFICPTPELRKIFAPDIIVYVRGVEAGRFEDTNKLFVPPTKNEARHFFELERGQEQKIILHIQELLLSGEIRQ